VLPFGGSGLLDMEAIRGGEDLGAIREDEQVVEEDGFELGIALALSPVLAVEIAESTAGASGPKDAIGGDGEGGDLSERMKAEG